MGQQMIKPVLCSIITSLLSVPVAAQSIDHLYDRQIIHSITQQPISLQGLAQQLRDVDVVFVGEYHGNAATHLLQAELQAALYQQRPQQILSLEQFNQDHQTTVDAYLQGKLGEQELIDEATAWDNYRASYRPLMEFAKVHQLPVLAANARADWVRCVGRQGEAYLDQLSDTERQTLPSQPFYSTPEYQQKFLGVMHGSTRASTADDPMKKRFAAQLLRDNQMADTIVKAHHAHPQHQIIHLNGTFHSESHLGTVASVKQLAPQLKLAVISPIQIPLGTSVPDSHPTMLGDYVYYIASLPNDFVDPQKRAAALQQRFAKADQAAQSCRSFPLGEY